MKLSMIIGLTVVVCAAGGIAALGQEALDIEPIDPLPSPVVAERYRGVVNPSRQVVLSAPVAGILEAVEVEEGDHVEVGDVLAQMDDGIQRVVHEGARLRAASDAEIRRAGLALEESEVLLTRIEEALAAEAASEWEVRRVRLQRDQAAAALDAARDQREVARANERLEAERLLRYTVRAPFSGVVVRVVGVTGATLGTEDAILSMAALDPLEAQLFLPVALYGLLEVGREYTLVGDAPVERELVGRLKTIDPIIDSASRSFRCVFTIENPDLELPAGFTVRMPWPQDAPDE